MKGKRFLNRIIGLVLCMAVVLTMYGYTAYGVNLPSYSGKIFVTDNANVLSEEVEDYIVNRCNTLRNSMISNKNKEVNVVVLTVDFLPDGYDSEEYANAVANDWKIGSEDVDGMLILIVPGEYKQWITVSKGLEKYFSGGELTNIIYDHFPDDGFDENYDNAVKGVVDDVLDELENIYGSAATSPDYQGSSGGNGYNNYYNYDSYGSYGISSIIRGVMNFMWVIILIIILIVLFARPRRRYYGGGYRRPRGGFFFGPIIFGGPRPRGPRPPRPPRGPGGFGGGPRVGGPRGGGFGGFGGGPRGGGFGGGGHSGFGGKSGGFRGGGGGRK